MKFLIGLKPAVLGLAAVWLTAGCATTRPKPEASAAAEAAITAAELAAVLNQAPLTHAPAEPAGDALTPAVALRLAAEKNPEFAEYAAVREAALAEVKAASGWQNPVLELGAGRGKTRGSPSTSGFEYSIGLFQPIEWPGKRGVRKEAAEAGVKVAELDEALFRSTLRADVLRAFWTVIACKADAELAEQQSKLAAEQLRLAEAQTAAGELNAAALLPFRREAQTAEGMARQLKVQHELSLSLLRRLCGGELPSEKLHGGIWVLWMEAPVLPDAARELALKKHPAILKLEAEKRRCELLVKQAELASRPDLTPGVEFSRGVDVTSWAGKLAGALPFWNRNKPGVDVAKAEQKRVEAQLASKRLEVAADVKTAVLELAAAKAKADDAREICGTLAQSKKALEEMETRGEAARGDVLVHAREALAGDRERCQAELSEILAWIQFEQAIGYGEMK